VNVAAVKDTTELVTALIAAGTAIVAAIGGITAWLNSRQTRRFGEMLRSEEHAQFIDKRADDRIGVAFATVKDLENKWRRHVEVDLGKKTEQITAIQAEIKLTSSLLSERIGQVDRRAETAHSRLDTHIAESDK